MPSKTKPMTDAELEAYEAKRNLGAELLQSVREMKAGQVRTVLSPAIEARKKTGLSQSQFTAFAGCVCANAPRLGARAQAAQRRGTYIADHCPH